MGLFGCSVTVPHFLGMCFGCGLLAVVVVHHLLRLLGQVTLAEHVLRPVVMHESDHVGQLCTSKIDLLAEGAFLGGDHAGRVVPHLGGEIEGVIFLIRSTVTP